MKRTLSIICLLIITACNTDKTERNTINTQAFSNSEIDAKVDSIMSKMTLDEKLVQIEGIRPRDIMVDDKFSPELAKEVMPHGIGHFCQFSSGLTLSPNELRDFVREVQHWLMTKTETKIPAIFHEEAITGFATQGATTYPQQIGMGCTWNPELIQECSNTTRLNMRAAGATYALSPMLDMSRTAHWSRLEESYGEDPYLTSCLGVSFVKGLQGNNFKTGVAATTKHFAGYGTQNDNPKELYEDYIMPHEAVMKLAGSKSVMPSYGKYKGVAVAASSEMLTDILRTHLKFDGVVISDYGAVSLIHKGHKQANSLKDAAIKALTAGIDIEVSAPVAFPFLPEALEEGLISIDVINTAVKRSLIMKTKLGLLDSKPQIGIDGNLNFDPPAYRDLAYRAATQSIVLLKNDGILPLKKDIKKVALLGPNSSTYYCMLGDYTYQSMISFWHSKEFDPENPKLYTLHEGLKSRLGEHIEIMQERGCDWSAPLESIIDNNGLGDDRLSKLKMMTIKGLPQPDLEKAVAFAEKSDVIIAAVGENLYLCGEGRQRKGIKLPGEQEAFVQKLIDTGKPVVLVLFGGRQQIVSKFKDKCAAIVQAWFPGEEGGNAIADILVGNTNPSGKLCVTYPATESKMETNYKNGYDNVDIQYPFGYGLSYTNYEYTSLEGPPEVNLNDDSFTLSLQVKNTGEMDGDEIVQLYVSPKDTNSTMKPIQLKGFQRVSLKSKEQKSITFEVSPEQLVQFKNNQWILEPGNFEFKIGASSTDIRLSAPVEIIGENKILEDGRQVFFSLNK
ncbi:glycoside hydrolase family 3 N-terminal domain-containing protein [Seonamhaeicola maritimus]|uniref:Beta-glucosidase n=1 Tax=Seonamhaeicola maritimus TaxID=2591822 RepID=A0A5C7GER9_9FLAO|nr:glycoside hydrolase family 3 N-terminal domain-containing protein [Seonamhaeicola maritimus]TXG35401.1 beta-glucosidase [Seonamhaeicola maritimus]